MTRFKVVFAVAVGTLLAQATARAQWEVEADPVAIGLKGYSAHVGYRVDVFRADLGAFGADIPESLHGNEGWKSRTSGVGAKFDYVGSGRGMFAGVEANHDRTRYTLTSAGESIARNGFAAGARLGYRFWFGQSRVYLAPWLGVDYTFGEIGAAIGGRVFGEKRVQLFPTVHAGWRF